MFTQSQKASQSDAFSCCRSPMEPVFKHVLRLEPPLGFLLLVDISCGRAHLYRCFRDLFRASCHDSRSSTRLEPETALYLTLPSLPRTNAVLSSFFFLFFFLVGCVPCCLLFVLLSSVSPVVVGSSACSRRSALDNCTLGKGL